MFGFIKKAFFTALAILSSVNLLNPTPLKCVLMNNQKCKVRRPQIVNLNRDDLVVFPFSIKTSKCSGSCKNINNPYENCVFLMLLKI